MPVTGRATPGMVGRPTARRGPSRGLETASGTTGQQGARTAPPAGRTVAAGTIVVMGGKAGTATAGAPATTVIVASVARPVRRPGRCRPRARRP
ncbi:hypothetical protein BCD48_36130 [Pseudofrankia sp. BMG5.36]|nr:hypothetical protein BCD48_36130 [Pseudofrankia sp. BMG5.36]